MYKTSSTDVAMIGMCRKAYGRIADYQSSRDWKDGDETYAGMVEVSRALMKARRSLLSRCEGRRPSKLALVHSLLCPRHTPGT